MKKILTILCLAAALTLSACWGKSDADLQKAADTAVKAKAPGVTVTVKDGVATLEGEVADAAAKTAAETAAKVDGIKSVTNNLKLKPTPTPTPAAASSADKTKIEDALKAKGFKDVTVDTTTTPATIRGTVPKGKLAEAVKVAQEAAGKPVKNEVTEK
ncbi:MAG TPA: BON domain-containing protein [Pyrinomonadaceae bacterium]|nr:BON domain-containing protein [Pyrinomonadaceae bacterium]